MTAKLIYRQYCPLAMSSEFLCQRWTMLILRELLEGSTSFNDISRGLPRMSRSLLSRRLKELVEIGVLEHKNKNPDQNAQYTFTQAGKALEPVVMIMAEWGQKWLTVEPSVENIDVDLLMWDIRRHTNPLPFLPNPFIVHIFLNDVPENMASHWLVFENNDVDLCHIDRNFDVDVEIDIGVRKLTKIWMGWEDFDSAINDGEMIIEGPKKYTKIASDWFGQSSVAHIKKIAPSLRLNY